MKKSIAEFSLSYTLSSIFHSTSTHTSVCTYTIIRHVQWWRLHFLFLWWSQFFFASVPFWSDLNSESIEIHTFALQSIRISFEWKENSHFHSWVVHSGASLYTKDTVKNIFAIHSIVWVRLYTGHAHKCSYFRHQMDQKIITEKFEWITKKFAVQPCGKWIFRLIFF